MAGTESTPPVFSILLPTHNFARILPIAIRSALWQTFQSFELLIVGDGCTDNTGAVVGSFQDPRIRWFDLPKATGIGYANRNVVLRQAQGKFVAYLGQDDLWLPDHLEQMLGAIETEEIEFAYSRALIAFPEGILWPGTFNLHDPRTMERFLRRKPMNIPLASVVHRRNCLDRYGYWDESLPSGGDLEFWTRILRGGQLKRFAYVPVPTSLKCLAPWQRGRRNWWSRMRLLKSSHAVNRILPSELQFPVRPGQPEQLSLMQELEMNPMDQTLQIRKAVTQLLDARLSRVDDLLPLILGTLGRRIHQSLSFLPRFFYRRDFQKQRNRHARKQARHTRS